MKKILVLGGYGMLGHKLIQELGSNFETRGTVRAINPELNKRIDPARLYSGIDALHPETLPPILDEFRPNYILNCIGIIKHLEKDHSPEDIFSINADFPHRLADMAFKRQIRVINFSTDCVFAGTKGNYSNTDIPDALDLYGQSKSKGELTDTHTLTLRSSFIGRSLRHKLELLEWLISRRGQTIKGYQKAIWSGFTTAALAQIVKTIIDRGLDLSGIWNVSMPAISKYELLKLINESLGLNLTIIPDDSIVCDRSLDGSAFLAKTGLTHPSWVNMIDALKADSQTYD